MVSTSPDSSAPDAPTARRQTAAEVPGPRRFVPQLEGMRALAALGVLTTHVAFQTRAVEIPVLGPVLGRLDLAVALFFGLSGFLLWRPWVAAAHGGDTHGGDTHCGDTHGGGASGGHPPIRRYLRHRVVRIWPAYLVVVVLVLTLLPDAQNADATVWLANLTLTQVFVPLSLTAGLTQMWSLSVEVAFYLLLPLLGLALVTLRGRRVRWRIPALFAIGAASLTWGWVAVTLPVPAGVEPKNWVVGHLPWFLAGLVLAELVGLWESRVADPRAVQSRWLAVVIGISGRRWLMFAVLVVAYGLACTPIAGPTGLGDLHQWQFAVKMVLGAICAYAILAPLLCAPGPFRFLDSRVMQALGRWSYGIFIWHIAVLAVVFGLFGIVPFNGDTVLVWAITVVVTIGVSAASYAFVEEPARRWLRRRETARATAVRQESGIATDQAVTATATTAGN
ncbi:putative acyltransferase [Gordonia soli NBRC 108243]|uniref:Putative acyltransferase n=1 Tax=Gordonia soli NBRC 108243 TaxID=1223545 RepID=M0QF46_9ACTN|nr:putative acyltransferase [Gordonia soli NBRC 108243]